MHSSRLDDTKAEFKKLKKKRNREETGDKLNSDEEARYTAGKSFARHQPRPTNGHSEPPVVPKAIVYS